MDTDCGKNNGRVGGVVYFKCDECHGLFVRLSAVEALAVEEVEKMVRQERQRLGTKGKELFDSFDGVNNAGTPPAGGNMGGSVR